MEHAGDEQSLSYEGQQQHSLEQSMVPASLLPSVLNRLGLSDTPNLRNAETAELLAALGAQGIPARVAAVRSSGKYGATMVESLVTALNDPAWEVRAAAVWALGECGEHAPLDALRRAANDEDSSVRAAALRTLGVLGDRVSIEPLVRALDDPDWQVREVAASTLGEREEQAPQEPLPVWLDNEHTGVREAASMPLERLPSETSPIPGGRPNTRKPPQRPARRQPRRFSALADGVLAALLILGMAVSWLVIAQRLHPSQSSAPVILQAYHGHVDGPAVWSTDSAYVSFLAESTSSAETVFVWERATGHLTGHVLHTLLVNSERVAVFAPDGQHIAFAELDQNEKEAVQVWDTLSWQHILTAYSFATYPVVLWTADSSSIVIPNDRGAVQAWSIATGRQLADCRVPPIAYLSSNALLSPDGQRVLYGYGQQHMYLLNLKTCKLLTFPSSDANSTFWSPQGTRFATISLTDASTVQVWDAMTGQNLENFHLGASVSTINWTPDGSRIVIADEKGVAVVDVATQRIVLNVTPAGTQLPPVWALSPDGTRLATQVGANVVQLWDAVTGHKLNAYQGQGKRVTVLAWSPDSRSLAAGSGDGTGQVWSGNREPAILHSGSSSILNMTWSPDGKCIAVGGLDGRMWVWQVN